MDKLFRYFPKVRGGSSRWVDQSPASVILNNEFFGPQDQSISLETGTGALTVNSFVPILAISIATSVGLVVASGNQPVLAESLLLTTGNSEVQVIGQSPQIILKANSDQGEAVVNGNTIQLRTILIGENSELLITGFNHGVTSKLQSDYSSVNLDSARPIINSRLQVDEATANSVGHSPSIASDIISDFSELLVTGYSPQLELKEPSIVISTQPGQLIVNSENPTLIIYKKEFINVELLSLVKLSIDRKSEVGSINENSYVQPKIEKQSTVTTNINKKSYEWNSI